MAFPYEQLHQKTPLRKTPRKPKPSLKNTQPSKIFTTKNVRRQVRPPLRRFASDRATRLAAARKPIPQPACSPFRISKKNALSSLIFRSRMELSCFVETMLPYHTTTALALLTSMLSVSRRSSGWTPKDG